MKRKTRMISALMYAMASMACFGVLHFMKKVMEPPGPVQAAGTEPIEEPSDSSRGIREDTGELVPVVMDSETEKEETAERKGGYAGWKKEFPLVWTPPQGTEVPYVPPDVTLATDLHYQSALTDDGGEAFQLFVERSDGKVIRYLSQLLEASPDEVIEEKPATPVFSDSITINGEKVNHQELADRLKRVQDAGVWVLVIPGNHDINNGNAAVYYGTEKAAAPSIDGPESHDTHHEHGYDQVLSRNSDSLSYAYVLDERNRLLMLDFCQCEPDNKMEDRIKDTATAWMDEQLVRAGEEGILVVPIVHHNLLAQNRMYTTQYAMDNNQDVIRLLQKYRLPLFFSGYLHVQRMRKYKVEPGVPEAAYGIQEIIIDAPSIPPYQYGHIIWEEDRSISYETRSVDVSAWARKTGIDNPDLLDFKDWSFRYIQKLISDQIRGVVKNPGNDVERSMAATYAGVYIDYYTGRKIDAKGIKGTKGYRWWERNMLDSCLLRELNTMIADSGRDNNYFLLPEEQGWFLDQDKIYSEDTWQLRPS